MPKLRWIVPMLACLPAAGFAASKIDGSKPLICALQQVMDVESPQRMTAGLPGEMGAPDFMWIDFDKKTVTGPQRTTPIRLLEKNERQIVMQGTELGLGWTLAVNGQDGDMTGSMVDADGTVVVFGSCMPSERR